MEAKAVARVFGPAVACSSTKPLVGHTLGASGAIEAGFCWLMLARRVGGELRLPPHRWDGIPDTSLPSLRLAAAGEGLLPKKRAILLSNSFGFGGNNCTLIFGEADAC